MFRKFTGLIISILLLGCGVSKNPPYISENFELHTTKHQRIAILPYEPSTTWQKRENGKFNLWQEQIEISGPYIQKKFFTALAKRINKGKVNLALQSFIITNKKLKENKISYPTLKNMDKASLSKLLNVDALILIEYFDNTDKSIERPGATNPEDLNKNMLFTASLFDGLSGNLLWRKDLLIPIETRADTKDRLAVKAINSFVKLFPYHLSDGLIDDKIIEIQLP